MGGRMATMVADELSVGGLLVYGYPFHPLGRPDRLRTEHLKSLRTKALIVQGERDPFGSRAEVKAYQLSPNIELAWMPDGDHSLKPRASSGMTEAENLEIAIEKGVSFITSRA